MNACPTLAQWQAVLTQGVSGPEEEAFSQHALACVACQQVLDSLSRPDGLPSAWLVQAALDTPVPVHSAADTPPLGRVHDPFRTMDFPGPASPATDRGPLIPGYEILEELGRGGMGVVFKARHLELGRLVALKMLRDHALADASLLARFRDEARAVARMQHPGLVQIYEVGLLEGQPYLALEYIPGPSLDRQLQGTPQLPRDAAALLVPLAQAIHAAHLQGIIHRDLKPANVLLTWSRAPEARACEEARASGARLHEALPKITDFGLAKPLAEDSRRTETGMVVGTPCYMAPEQAAGQPRLGPAVDIYALGAILYEMLTGRPPFKGVTAHDTVHLVLTEEPVPPRRLQPQVPRDLETICLKCLHKEPSRRYLTAADLAADVARFLEGRPILARPAGRVERVVKWCRRYPAVAALLVVATLAAVAATTLAVWAFSAERQAVAERDEKDRQRQRAEDHEKLASQRLGQVEVEKQRVEAERERVEAEKRIHLSVREFLQRKLLAQSDIRVQTRHLLQLGHPATGVELDPKISVLLQRAAAELTPDKIDANFPNQPLIQAELLLTVGHSQLAVGQTADAIGHLERARDLFETHGGADHLGTLGSLHFLASAYQKVGKLPQSLALSERVVAALKKQVGNEHLSTLQAQNNLAETYRQSGMKAQALALYEQVYATKVKTLGADHWETLTTLNNLAVAYSDAGKIPQAIVSTEQAHAGMIKTLGAEHPDTLIAAANLATQYHQLGRLVEAVPLFEQVRADQVKKLGVNHLETLLTYNNLAAAYWQLGQLDKSIPLFEVLVQGRQKCLGRQHTETQLAVANLGVNYLDAGRLSDALPLLEEAFATGRKNPQLFWVGRTLLDASAQAGKAAQTMALVRELQPHLERAFTQPSPQRAIYLAQFGQALVQVKEYPKAEPFLRECLSYRVQTQSDAWTTFNTKSLLGGALLGQKKYVEAEPLLLAGYVGMKHREKMIPPQSKPSLVDALERLVQLCGAMGKKTDAAKWQKELEELQAVTPTGKP